MTKYRVHFHHLDVPYRSSEHAIESRTRHSVMIQTTCSANCNFKTLTKSKGSTHNVGFPHPYATAEEAIQILRNENDYLLVSHNPQPWPENRLLRSK
jgi:hypothetical protein